MSAFAQPLPFPDARAGATAVLRGRLELPLRLATFAALCLFCCLHYALLVQPAAGGRALAVTAAVTAGGAALALTAHLQLPRPALLALRVAVALATLALALLATGVRARLLLPHGWVRLGDGIDRGTQGLNSFSWPYDGHDGWLRLTILLGMPALAAPAALVAFWPGARARTLRTAIALALLLAIYGTGVTQRELGGWGLRGAGLLLLTAAWLWLPRVRARDGLTAAAAIGACALAALPLAATLNAGQPWLDYRSWSLAGPTDARATTFDWNHSYGPIDWPRDQSVVLEVSSKQAHYWKVEGLDRFDGLRWVHVDASLAGDAGEDVAQPANRAWNQTITMHIRGLRTDTFPVAGTAVRVDAAQASDVQSDGTVQVLDAPLSSGDSYTVRAYVPDPSAAQMRAAPHAYPWRLLPYTYFDLPAAHQSGLRPAADHSPQLVVQTTRTVGASVPGHVLAREEEQRVLHSPYAATYRLARRLAAGQATTYGVVRAVENHLESTAFQYSERPPLRRYPLASFLLHDRVGYCQQYSGAMALLLRMNGIPARVVGGFSPGAYNQDLGQWQVRDIDAHSWVEVWFSGIGWVPFDPTPSAAPASSQANPTRTASAARAGGSDHGSGHTVAKSDVASGGASATGGSGGAEWIVALLVAFAALFVAALWLVALLGRRRRRLRAHDDPELAELRSALARLGYALPPRTTLTELERRLRVLAGPAAAHYAALLRERRFGPPGATGPGPGDRRALRHALTAGGGPLARLRGLLALPPHPRRHAF